jgi:hypothetical protein
MACVSAGVSKCHSSRLRLSLDPISFSELKKDRFGSRLPIQSPGSDFVQTGYVSPPSSSNQNCETVPKVKEKGHKAQNCFVGQIL